jgi:hypothetical protein
MSAISSARLPINKIAIGTLITAGIAAVANNVYSVVFTALTGNSFALINPVSITLASLIPMLVAGVAYFILARFAGNRASLLYLIGTLGFTLFSFGGPLGGQLPDGSTPPAFFAALTLPMHVIAGGLAAFALPYFTRR